MKKRIFYLDFIRAFATITILLTHYNAVYVYQGNVEALRKVVLGWRVANIYIGDFGVSLFLIISGASLMAAYEKGLDLKTFYKKRFLSIYPMFWIAYFWAFLDSFYRAGGINRAIPKRNIIFSILGMDGYLGTLFPTFYLLGEWFLGFIIIVYIIFPLLRKGVLKHPVLTAGVVMGLYAFFECYYKIPFTKNIFLFIRLPEIVFGMMFQKYIRQADWKAGAAGGIILLCNGIFQPPIDSSIQMTYVGIGAFLLLNWLSRYLEGSRIILKVSNVISKYSYAVFLVHHYLITVITGHFDLTGITVLESYILFILCCSVITVFAGILYHFHGYVMKQVQNLSLNRKSGEEG